MSALPAQRQSQGSKQLSSLNKAGRANVHPLCGRLHGVPADGFAQRLQQDVAGAAQQAADDHALGVDQVAQARDQRTSPADARSITSARLGASPFPSATSRVIAGPDATVSRQPRLPQ